MKEDKCVFINAFSLVVPINLNNLSNPNLILRAFSQLWNWSIVPSNQKYLLWFFFFFYYFFFTNAVMRCNIRLIYTCLNVFFISIHNISVDIWPKSISCYLYSLCDNIHAYLSALHMKKFYCIGHRSFYRALQNFPINLLFFFNGSNWREISLRFWITIYIPKLVIVFSTHIV